MCGNRVFFGTAKVCGRGKLRDVLVTMSMLSSTEIVWLSEMSFAGELLGPLFKFPNSLSGETSGEKKPSMGSIPKASRWPVSLTVIPVFLRNVSVSPLFNFFPLDS